VLYLDVDHFKHINDTYGHAAGDAVLVEVARRLQHTVRRTDTVARLAGDEFVILLDPIDAPDDALHTAQKVVAAIRPPIHLRGDVALNVTPSMPRPAWASPAPPQTLPTPTPSCARRIAHFTGPNRAAAIPRREGGITAPMTRTDAASDSL